MARYWSDGYGETEQVGAAASYSVTVIDRVRWDNKQDRLYFDNAPTLGSGSPVTSDGIARALNEVREYVRQKDNELFYIDVVTQDGIEALRDKTYIDIHEAYKSGDTLILRFADSADKCAYFYDFQGNVFRFVLFEATDVLSMYTYWISPDDLLHVEMYSAPYKRPNPETFAITYGEDSVVYDGSKHASVNIPKVPAWALSSTKPKYTASEVGAEEKGIAASRVSAHNSNANAHADIRNMINNVVNMFNSYVTQGQFQQVYNYTQTNAANINQLRTDAVLKKDIVDDLYTNTTVRPLSARQGMLLRSAVDKITPKYAGLLLWDGYSLHAQDYYVAVPSAHGLPIADEGGRLSTNTPADALHCANKQYVDDAVLSSVVITAKTVGTVNAIKNSAAVKPKNIKLFGKGKQRQYEGNQLLGTYESVTISGITSKVDNGKLHYYGTATKDETFIWIIGNYGNTTERLVLQAGTYSLTSECIMYCYDGTTRKQYRNKFTIEEDVSITGVLYNVTITNGSTYDEYIDIMLNAGDTLLDWEPYVGNAPSPSIKYPQKAEFLGESGSIQSWLIARNLFAGNIVGGYLSNVDGSITIESEIVQNVNCLKTFTPLSENILTVVVQGYSADMPIAYAYRIGFYDKDKKWISNVLITQEITKLQAVENAKYVRFSAGELDKMAVYFGDVSNALYEAPTSQPFIFQTPNGLRGIPLGKTIPDAIKNSPIHMSGVYWDKVEQQYYIGDTENEDGKDVQRIYEKVFDGTENILKSADNADGYMYDTPSDVEFLSNRKNFLFVDYLCSHCSKLKFYTTGSDKDEYGGVEDAVCLQGNTTNRIRMKFNSVNSVTDIESCKAYLKQLHESGIPLTVVYILANPITTDTSAEDQAQYNSIHMNYPNTTIVNDEGAYMEVEYVVDPELFIKDNYVDKAQHQALADRVLVLEQLALNL